MRSRLFAAGAAVWTVVFIVLAYVRFTPQPWYVAVVAVVGVLALFAAVVGTGGRGRVALLLGLGVSVVAALLGGWTAGPVLLPAIVGIALAVRSGPV